MNILALRPPRLTSAVQVRESAGARVDGSGDARERRAVVSSAVAEWGRALWVVVTTGGPVEVQVDATGADTTLRAYDLGLDAVIRLPGERVARMVPGESAVMKTAVASLQGGKATLQFSAAPPQVGLYRTRVLLTFQEADQEYVSGWIELVLVVTLAAPCGWRAEDVTTDALEAAILLAGGARTKEDAARRMTERLANPRDRFRYRADAEDVGIGALRARAGEAQVDPTTPPTEVLLLCHLLVKPRAPKYPHVVDCYDVSGLLYALLGLMGVKSSLAAVSSYLWLPPVRAIGGPWCEIGTFGAHQVVQIGDVVLDGCLVASETAGPPFEPRALIEASADEYFRRVDLAHGAGLPERDQLTLVPVQDAMLRFGEILERSPGESVGAFAGRVEDATKESALTTLLRELASDGFQPVLVVCGSTDPVSDLVLFEVKDEIADVVVPRAAERPRTVRLRQCKPRSTLGSDLAKALKSKLPNVEVRLD